MLAAIHARTKESERVLAGAAKAANLPIHHCVGNPEAGRQQLTGSPAQRLGRPVPAAALRRSHARVLTPLHHLRQKGAYHATRRSSASPAAEETADFLQRAPFETLPEEGGSSGRAVLLLVSKDIFAHPEMLCWGRLEGCGSRLSTAAAKRRLKANASKIRVLGRATTSPRVGATYPYPQIRPPDTVGKKEAVRSGTTPKVLRTIAWGCLLLATPGRRRCACSPRVAAEKTRQWEGYDAQRLRRRAVSSRPTYR